MKMDLASLYKLKGGNKFAAKKLKAQIKQGFQLSND